MLLKIELDWRILFESNNFFYFYVPKISIVGKHQRTKASNSSRIKSYAVDLSQRHRLHLVSCDPSRNYSFMNKLKLFKTKKLLRSCQVK